MKKILFLICFILLINNNFLPAEASEFTDLEQGIYYEAVTYLVEKGYANGYADNTIRLNNTITRAELAKLAVSILYDNESPTDESDLTDIVGHWAERYIKIANKNGIINGYPDKTFRPDNKITYDEVITIVTRMFASKEEIDDLKIWPTDFIVYAKDKGILENVNYRANSFQANRGDSFLMLYNALTDTSNIDFSESISSISISTAPVRNETRMRYSTELPKNNIDSILVTVNINHDIILEDITIPVRIELTNKTNNESMIYNERIKIVSNTERTTYDFYIDIQDFSFNYFYYDEYKDTEYVAKIYHTSYIYDSKVLIFKWDNTIETEYAKQIKISNLLFTSSDDELNYTNTFYLSDDFTRIIIKGDFEWPETKNALTVPLYFVLDGPRSWGWEGNTWFIVDEFLPSKERVLLKNFYVDNSTGKWPAGTYVAILEAEGQQLIRKVFEIKY